VLSTDPVNPNFSVQDGETRSRGIELEAKASLADGLRLTAAYAYLDVEFTRSNNNGTVDYRLLPCAAPARAVSLEGKVPTGIPRHSASALAGLHRARKRQRVTGCRHRLAACATSAASWGDRGEHLQGRIPPPCSTRPIRYDLGQLGPELRGDACSAQRQQRRRHALRRQLHRLCLVLLRLWPHRHRLPPLPLLSGR
jgi:iron complex outermembrane receptor protein